MKKYVKGVDKVKKKLHLTRRGLIMIGSVAIIALSGTTVAIVYKVTANGVEQTMVKTMSVKVQQGNLTLGVSGSGTTYVGTVDQTWDVGYGDSGIALTVEEVLASAGDTVSKGDSLLKVSKEEVASLIEYYEKKIADANTILSTAKVAYESNLAQAKYDYESNLMLGDTARLQYQASIEELQNQVDGAKEAISNADDKISEYTKALAKDSYYTKYKVASLKGALTTANKALKAAETTVTTLDKTYGKDKKALIQTIGTVESKVKTAQKNVQSAQSAYDKKLQLVFSLIDSKNNPSSYEIEASYLTELKKAYEALQTAIEEKTTVEQKLTDARGQLETLNKEQQTAEQELKQAKEKQQEAARTYEQALTNYEKAKDEATSNLKTLKNKYPSLKAEYQSALLNQETKTISLNKEYKISTLTYENAKSIYDAAVDDLDADVKKAETNLEELKDSLTMLTSIKEDGIIKASQDGTISKLGYEVENSLEAGKAVTSYIMPEIMDIDVAVSQDQIAMVKVGDTAKVSITGQRGSLEGKVKEIATSPATSGSVSNVTYTVTVEVDNKEGTMEADAEARIFVETETLENVLYVPINAVSKSGDIHTVTKQMADGTTEKVTVKTGKENGSYIVITEGLSAGDSCVMEQK